MTRLAALQFKAHKEDADRSLAALCHLIAQAGDAGAQIIVCPEMATSGYLFEDARAIVSRCEPQQGGALPALSTLAARYGAYVICGYPELATGAGGAVRLYNSARVIGPDGTLLCNYRKRLLYTADMTWAAEGDTPYPLIDTPWGTLTVGICMDLNDDRFTEFLRQKSPLLTAFCTNWLDEGEDVLPYWCHRMAGVRGLFVAANTYGPEESAGHPPTRFCGRAAILAFDGSRTVSLLARARKSGDSIVLADV